MNKIKKYVTEAFNEAIYPLIVIFVISAICGAGFTVGAAMVLGAFATT